jgi:hypothetical protein
LHVLLNTWIHIHVPNEAPTLIQISSHVMILDDYG